MKKILIVEDDPMLAEIYQKKFKKNPNFKVIHASSGTEAQEKAKQEKPDLMLLDLVLPEMDGFDVLKAIRKDPSLDSIKIIPFSNLSQEDNQKKLEDLGANGFISKAEHTPQQLIDEVEKIFKESENETVKEKTDGLEMKTDKFSKEDQKRVLIIEAEEIFSKVFGNKIEMAGFEVRRSSTGKEGMNLLTQEKFGLVVIDIALFDLETKKIIENFKMQFPKASTKFVILKDEIIPEKDLDELKKVGIQGIIDKNKIEPDQFLAGVKKLLK